jgi:hypothetical protein
MIKAQDALYNLFQQNSNWEELLSPKNFNYWMEKTKALTDTTENISDGEFMSWIVSRAALKASSFYKMLIQSFPDGVAPFASQILGVYNIIARSVNGDAYIKAFDAIRKSTFEEWPTLSKEQRENRLK